MTFPPAGPPPPPPLPADVPDGPPLSAPLYALSPPPKKSSVVPIVVTLMVVTFGGIFVLGILGAIAIPARLRARLSANESVVAGTVRTMVSAQVAWAGSHGGRFTRPACLAEPAGCGDTQASSFLPMDIATLQPRHGYDFGFVLRPGADNGFAYWASPSRPGVTGNRRFCVDETGLVRVYGPHNGWAAPSPDQPRCPEVQ